MYMYRLHTSPLKDKKYLVITPKGKKIHFGAQGYDDFTTHKDEKRKNSYIKRHKKNEDWTDLNTAGAWSRWLLWNKPTLNESVNDMETKFNIVIRT